MRSLYSAQRTWLHAIPAWIKLVLLSVCGTLLVLVDRPMYLVVACVAVLLVFVSLGPAAWRRLRVLGGVAIAGGLILVFHWALGTTWLGAASALRLASAATLALMLTLSTRFEDLLAVLEAILHPLQRIGVPTERIALGLGLMLRFAENFYVQWQRLDDAYRARTGRGGGLRLLAPLTIRTLQTAERVADALAARLGR
ncbi:energy-coupling factor transporter transmembrane protein EcfT [Variovorax sp. J22P240]|uniref:energy-coupling factor transporter transmembrane component T family protein n=1 Tax=Variovorax sp. J22P240 TaxID=3053514 RepID=UPI0025790E36|nr:energy-coupling factor transporter transmembrane protein EcfT [Variovorax sp. J22P240]MDL9998764.1 energy-coupling factor transporter transmembrane protein EcfT [Variovorax sp. J22P240]